MTTQLSYQSVLSQFRPPQDSNKSQWERLVFLLANIYTKYSFNPQQSDKEKGDVRLDI